MSRIVLYFKSEPTGDRWVLGDRYIRAVLRRVVRGRPRISGLNKVFLNLCHGLDRLGLEYFVNLPFHALHEGDRIGVLGVGRGVLSGYDLSYPIVAGIGLMTHPAEWPTLCDEYPVVRYLQHSQWASRVYEPYFGARCGIWPVGIDTAAWTPTNAPKDIDFLLYDKVHWDRERNDLTLIQPIRRALLRRGARVKEIQYGNYSEHEFRELLRRSRAMVFLTEHESQGLAYQECLASDVPVLAWQQGKYLDPHRFRWGTPDIDASSVPYFDARCGLTFRDASEFEPVLDAFVRAREGLAFRPRDYILENLSLEACARRFVDFLDEAVDGRRHGPSVGGVSACRD